MTNKLIEEAKKSRIKRSAQYTEDEIELAVAWAKDEVSIQGVARAMGFKNSGACYSFLALALRQYLR